MQQPALVILAAGMGSRFGGLKQITAVDDHGHAIIDFSLYDAYRAGFRKVVFIIKHEIEADFKAAVGHRIEKYFDVRYVFQELDKLPEGYTVPEGRVKPWGTGHAVLCCADVLDEPFAVINADDFYGPSVYADMYQYLSEDRPENDHAMMAYHLRNTVTENGTVTRGVCKEENGYLADIFECFRIQKCGNDAAYTDDDGKLIPLSGETKVSMNLWGFQKQMLDELKARFPAWLDANLPVNPAKCEYLLPSIIDCIIKEGIGTVRMLESRETWHGITYKEDMPEVIGAIAKMRAAGLYPETLLD